MGKSAQALHPLWAQPGGRATTLPLKTSGPSKKPNVDRQVPQVNPATAITFAPYRLDLRAGRLLRGNEPIALRPKSWSLLLYLAERPGVLVNKNELLDALWADVAVTESVLSKSIGELRVALGDSFKAPRLIETVSRRGFRFIAPISEELPVISNQLSVSSDRSSVVSDQLPASSGQGSSPASPLITDHWSLITSPFVGRAKELQRLAALFAKARAGERQVVFITGPTGIGKTALAEAFLDSPTVREVAAPVWIARGLCVEQHGPREAYMPVLEALERLARRPDAGRLAGLLRQVAPTWLAQMPWLIGDDDEQALRQSLQAVKPERMLREFAALMEALTTDVTVVLALEDLHWSDASTVDLLSVLAERHESARLLVIGTYRPADAVVREHVLRRAVRTLHMRQQCVELPLSDLTEEGVRSYLQARFLGSDFPPALARLIHKHTDGNPLFVVGVVDHLLSRGQILDTMPGWALRMPPEKIDLGVPDDVRLLIENQFDGVSPADRALLQAASVAGNEFSALVVAAALGAEPADVETRCEAFAHAQRFLRVAGHVEWPDRSVARRYAFTHELYRQVVYAEIPEGQCMQLHQRIGRALEAAYGAQRMEIAPQLAAHFERGHDEARALHYLIAAAAGARRRFASRQAMGYLEAALALVALLPDEEKRQRQELELRLTLGAALGDVHGFAAEPVRENYERAAQLCTAVGSAAQRFEVLYARWYLHSIRGERKETTTLVAQLDDLARRLGTAEQRTLADSALVRTATHDGRFADASHNMQRLRARQRRRKGATTPVAYGADPLVAATMHYAIALWFLGDVEGAQTNARDGLARARDSGNPFATTAALMQMALFELLCRRAGEGGDRAEKAISLAAEHGFAFWNAVASVLKGWALIQLGDAPEGIAHIERALSAIQTTGARFFSAFAYAFLAEGHLRAGAFADGLAAVNAGLAVAQSTVDRAYEPELWRLKGELLEKQSKVESSKPALSKVEGPKARRAKVEHNRPDTARQAVACFQRALQLARASQAKSLELRAATSLARAWQARGRVADARKLLGGVCKWFGARAGTADLVKARALLGELATAG